MKINERWEELKEETFSGQAFEVLHFHKKNLVFGFMPL